ncbi:MAG: hypothetical protein P8Z49_03135 [Acidobacteriota bacterium]
MKRLLFAAVFCILGLGLSAQSQGWGYAAIQPGYQFSSGDVNSSFLGSADFGFFPIENFGIHLGFLHYKGDFSFFYGPYGDFQFSKGFTVVELGPEYDFFVGSSGKSRLYIQLNAGYITGSDTVTSDTLVYNGAGYVTDVRLRSRWTWGFTFGYRHFWNRNAGFQMQASFHAQSYYDTYGWYYDPYALNTDFADARMGLVFRF